MARPQNSGDGTWNHLADGRWEWRLYVDGVRKRFRGVTQKACREQAAAYREALRHDGQDAQRLAADILLADYLPAWIEGRRHELRPATLTWYRAHIRASLVPALGHLTVAALTRQHVVGMMAELKGRGLAPRTVNSAKVTLGAAMQDARRDGLVSENVVRLVKRLPQPRTEFVPLYAPEIERLIDDVRGGPEEALYTLALTFGMRQAELLGLTWADVDGGVLRVRQTLHHRPIEGGLRLEEVKTQHSRRVLVMPAFISEPLERHRVLQAADRERLGDYWPEHWPDLIFRDSHGNPLRGPHVTRAFQRRLARLDIPQRRFHDLRHTCATFLFMKGVPMKVIQQVLGHSTVAITSDIYAHVLPQMQEEAFAPMGALLAPRNDPAPGSGPVLGQRLGMEPLK